jgi:hypothetical protein
MPDADRKRICDVLRRDEALVAREAARLLVQRMKTDVSSLSGRGDGTVPAVRLEGQAGEAEAMLVEDFRRLVGVVAFGLQVDEPRLVSEELQWLGKAGRARFEGLPGTTYIDLLIGACVAACPQGLDDEDCDVLDQLFAQARSGLAEIEPLL